MEALNAWRSHDDRHDQFCRLIPLLFGYGEPGKEILYPLSVVLFGGMIASTLLDQIVTPALLLLFGAPARHPRKRVIQMLKALSLVCLIVLGIQRLVSEPITVFSGEGERTPKQPQACIDSQGVVHLTFGVGEETSIIAHNADGSLIKKFHSYSLYVAWNATGTSYRSQPRLGRHHCHWSPQGKGRDGDILSYRSIDGGKNWFGPVKVNDVVDSREKDCTQWRQAMMALCGAFG